MNLQLVSSIFVDNAKLSTLIALPWPSLSSLCLLGVI